MNRKIRISIVIPCRNEGKFIPECLDSIIANDYPKEHIEILIVDGMSDDGTRTILEDYAKRYSFIKILDNPKKIAPVAMNIGIKKAKGDYILRADAHSIYDKDYVRQCVEYLEKIKADCIGGMLHTLPSQSNTMAKAIAMILSHPFGVSESTFRTKRKEGYVDTVPFGAYKSEIFDKVGFFNEKLVRNQDIELNSRIRKSGGKIYITPEIKSSYFAPATLKKLISQQFQNGRWNIYTQKIAPNSLSLRHFVPLCFVGGLIGSLILSPFFFWAKILFIVIFNSYILLNLLFSLKISFKEGFKYLPILPVVFFIFHFSYGLGSIWGILTFWRI